MASPDRLRLALERLPGTSWRRFEEFASPFLAAEFDALRTTASTSGDKGRDAEFYQPSGSPFTVLAFSVNSNWSKKLWSDAKKIQGNHPTARHVVYGTNQLIGAKGDEDRTRVRDELGLIVDLRDRSYFVERLHGGGARIAAAEKLAEEFVDPYLESAGVIEEKGRALSDVESKAAFVYLQLEREDWNRNRNLTRASYETLVRSVLRGSDDNHTIPRTEIYARVRELVPTTAASTVRGRVDAALKRLNKKITRHYQATDEFCLAHEERERLRDALAALEAQDQGLRRAAIQAVERAASEALYDDDILQLAGCVTALAEKVMQRQGEQFVLAVANREVPPIDPGEMSDLVLRTFNERPYNYKCAAPNEIVEEAFEILLRVSDPAVRGYLASLGDTYTLFSFLHETNDVQRAVKVLYGHGDVWVDTSIVLPSMIETLMEDQPLTNLLDTMRSAGLKLHLTPGVVDEVESNLRRAQTRAKKAAALWTGAPPALYSAYVAAGGDPAAFGQWAEQYRGDERPTADVAEALKDLFGLQLTSLSEAFGRASPDLRSAVLEVWREIHKKRRPADGANLETLAQHDAENWLGVLEKRRSERRSDLGFKTWWLTLDRQALRVKSLVEQRRSGFTGLSPVMSPEFILQYLRLGPLRMDSSIRSSELPLPVEVGGLQVVPQELLEAAGVVRTKMVGLPERLVRRTIRDEMDKRRRGSAPRRAGGELDLDSLVIGEW